MSTLFSRSVILVFFNAFLTSIRHRKCPLQYTCMKVVYGIRIGKSRVQTCNESSHFWFESSHLVLFFSRVESLYKFQWVESLKTSRIIHLFKSRVTSHHSLLGKSHKVWSSSCKAVFHAHRQAKFSPHLFSCSCNCANIVY